MSERYDRLWASACDQPRALLVLLAIGRVADVHGMAAVSLVDLSVLCRMSVAHLQGQLEHLTGRSLLIPLATDGRHDVRRYQLPLLRVAYQAEIVDAIMVDSGAPLGPPPLALPQPMTPVAPLKGARKDRRIQRKIAQGGS